MEMLCLVIIAAIIVYSVISYRKKIAAGCCGASADLVKKRKIADKNREHYPYHAVIKVDGMICGNCVRSVENALNCFGDVFARADLSKGSVDVLMKKDYSMEELYEALRAAGYLPYHYERENRR